MSVIYRIKWYLPLESFETDAKIQADNILTAVCRGTSHKVRIISRERNLAINPLIKGFDVLP